MQRTLLPEVSAVLQCSKAERIKFSQSDRWVGYSRAEQIIAKLKDIMDHAKVARMPNVLLVGLSDNGKSSILERHIRAHPLLIGEDGSPSRTVLSILMPAKPTESAFWSEILWALHIRHNERDKPDAKRRQAIEAMVYANVVMLCIDEFNHVANAGKEAVLLLAAIKNLSTVMCIPIVASGTAPAINALNQDSQLFSRFTPLNLPTWKLDREYLSFLTTYESLLPLAEASNLASRELAPVIFGMAGNQIGGTVRVLKEAAVYAIKNDRLKIDADLLKKINFASSTAWADAARRA